MRLPFGRPPEHEVTRLTRADADAVSRLHNEDFLRPWSAAEFDDLLTQETVFGFAARQVGRPKAPIAGFVLARVAAGEAEILTVAVARGARRAGLGRKLMEAVLRRLHAMRVEALFLEVDEKNVGALALYRRLGFAEVGRRAGYYDTAAGTKSSALVMRRDLA